MEIIKVESIIKDMKTPLEELKNLEYEKDQ